MERVIDLFSGCTWWVLRPAQAEQLLSTLRAEPWGESRNWVGGLWEAVVASGAAESELAGLDDRAILVTDPIPTSEGEWVVVESRAPVVAAPALQVGLSEHGWVHQFTTDIWVPWTEFKAWRHGEQVRRYALEFSKKFGDLVEHQDGHPVPGEAPPLTYPNPQNGYDAFFYPLAVMHGMGLSVSTLEAALDRPAHTYLLPE